MEFSGRLTSFPPAQLLQWAEAERCTGSLVLRRSRRQKRIFFRDGKVVGCLSDDPAEYYGQHLLLHGHLNEVALVHALSQCTHSGQRLGTALVELGLMQRKDVQRTLREQIEDTVCGVFLWQHGVFYFEQDPPPTSEIPPEPISTMGLVMEGTRWIDEMGRFRKIFPHDNVVLLPGPGWPGQELTPIEERITRQVDSKRSLLQIYSIVKGCYFRVLEAIYGLCLREVLDVGQIGDALESGTFEISVYDLLLEQAVEEQMRQDPSIPLDVLGAFYPVWIRKPSAEQAGQMADTAPKFWQHLDGNTPLKDLLAEDDEDRGRKLELLLLQLRQGNLALLPERPAAIEEHAEPGSPAREGWWQRLFGSRGS